jgi:hypothetical protein
VSAPLTHGRAPDGASPQRTRLAWRRTALTQTVCTLLLLRLGATEGLWPAIVTVGLGVAGWLGSMLVIQRRIAAMAARQPAGVGRALPLTALLLVGYALLGVLLVALS